MEKKKRFPRDIRNLVTLSAIAPKDFIFFTSGTKKTIANSTSRVTPSNVSMIVDFPSHHDDQVVVDDLASILNEHVQEGTSTTISLQHILNNNEISPIALANKIATLLDNAGGGRGGGDYIWTANTKNADDMIQICEELMYLDVAGKTIKSRLMVDATNEEVVEETMFAGVNKFVIDNDRQIDAIKEIVIDQGKTILR